MASDTFKALVVYEKGEGNFVRKVARRSIDDLPDGDVLINVRYSSLNYKDALSATGNKGITKNYPHTPGIDAAGTVVESRSREFSPGGKVIVSGYDLGMNTPGGYGQYIRVPSSWVVKLPETLTMRESMAYGTAGFTAAQSVLKLIKNGISPDKGEVLVTGATGGVGSVAVTLLAGAGYSVTAVTGKSDAKEFLMELGAKEVIMRDEADDRSGKPILKGRWAGVVDTVGGNILSSAIKATQYGGIVTCCGLVASSELITSVFPFIIRGVTLAGIDSQTCPMEQRLDIWKRLAGEWKSDHINRLTTECSLDELDKEIDVILRGGQRGRVVVDLS